MASKTILFNPVGIVHSRNIDMFMEYLGGWNIRCVYNPDHPWFSGKEKRPGDWVPFHNGRVPESAFRGVQAIVLFSAQPRIPHCSLLCEAAARSIPVIAIEEVYQMALEQGYVNEYLLPVDHLFAGSAYEKEVFVASGIPKEAVEVTGNIFTRKCVEKRDKVKAGELKKVLGVSECRRVATLSLAYQTLTGETLEIRGKLLGCLEKGLPRDYELLVKPHPAERGVDVEGFIKRYSPRANVVDRLMPIERVLSVTDVLFNRGNSQVIVDALQNDIPVAVIPMGRRTVFHELSMDDIIVNNSSDLERALKAIEKRGTGMYDRVIQKYLPLPSRENLASAMKRIADIACGKELANVSEKLVELALFWAVMGYVKEALKTLDQASGEITDKRNVEAIRNLIACHPDREDIKYLRDRCAKGTRKEWVILSLLIKTFYINGRKMGHDESEWLSDYPPRMNREFFLPYAYMLYWSLLGAGYMDQATTLLNRLSEEFGQLKEIKLLKYNKEPGNYLYEKLLEHKMRFEYLAKTAIKNLLWELRYSAGAR